MRSDYDAFMGFLTIVQPKDGISPSVYEIVRDDLINRFKHEQPSLWNPAKIRCSEFKFSSYKQHRFSNGFTVQLLGLINPDEKIEGIKQFRSLFDPILNLRDAKDAIEYVIDKDRIDLLWFSSYEAAAEWVRLMENFLKETCFSGSLNLRFGIHEKH